MHKQHVGCTNTINKITHLKNECCAFFFLFFLSQQFITQGVIAVHAYRRNYVWSINTLTFLYSYPTHRTTKELNP